MKKRKIIKRVRQFCDNTLTRASERGKKYSARCPGEGYEMGNCTDCSLREIAELSTRTKEEKERLDAEYRHAQRIKKRTFRPCDAAATGADTVLGLEDGAGDGRPDEGASKGAQIIEIARGGSYSDQFDRIANAHVRCGMTIQAATRKTAIEHPKIHTAMKRENTR